MSKPFQCFVTKMSTQNIMIFHAKTSCYLQPQVNKTNQNGICIVVFGAHLHASRTRQEFLATVKQLVALALLAPEDPGVQGNPAVGRSVLFLWTTKQIGWTSSRCKVEK